MRETVSHIKQPLDPLSITLKASTRAAHDSLETVVPLMSDGLDRAGYQRYLECLFSLYSLIEKEVINSHPSWFDEMSLVPRRSLLELDLFALGDNLESPKIKPGCLVSLPIPVDTHFHRLGVFYVLEGSALGSKVIRKHLESRHIIDVSDAARFFDPYGDRMLEVWRAFQAAIDMHSSNGIARKTIVDSAKSMFAFYERWLRLWGYP